MFHLVCKHLDAGDASKALAGELHRCTLATQSRGCKYQTSPITLGCNEILQSSELLRLFPNRSEDAIREQCKYWFWQVASSSRASLADLARATKGDWKLSQDDLQSLADLLTTVQYRDNVNNRRFFGSLETMLEHCVVTLASDQNSQDETQQAQHAIRVMQNVKKKLHGTAAENNLDVLRPRLEAKCECASATPVAILSMHMHARRSAQSGAATKLSAHACPECMHTTRLEPRGSCLQQLCNASRMCAVSGSGKNASNARASVPRQLNVRGDFSGAILCRNTSSAKLAYARAHTTSKGGSMASC